MEEEGELGIFPDPRAYMVESSKFFQVLEAIWRARTNMGGRAWNFSKSQGLYTDKKLYTMTRTSLCSVLCSFRPQSLCRECSLEFFQVPEPIRWEARNFSEFQNLYREFIVTRAASYRVVSFDVFCRDT